MFVPVLVRNLHAETNEFAPGNDNKLESISLDLLLQFYVLRRPTLTISHPLQKSGINPDRKGFPVYSVLVL